MDGWVGDSSHVWGGARGQQGPAQGTCRGGGRPPDAPTCPVAQTGMSAPPQTGMSAPPGTGMMRREWPPGCVVGDRCETQRLNQESAIMRASTSPSTLYVPFW